MTETMAEDRPDTNQEQPEPTSNGDPPADDPLSQIDGIAEKVLLSWEPFLGMLNDEGKSKLKLAKDQVVAAKKAGSLKDVRRHATTFWKTAGIDPAEFIETATETVGIEPAELTGNSADPAEAEVLQEPEPEAQPVEVPAPVDDFVEHDKRENPEAYWPVCENGKHPKNPDWAEQPCPKCKADDDLFEKHEELEEKVGKLESKALDKARDAYLDSPDDDELRKNYRVLVLKLDTMVADLEYARSQAPRPFGEHPAERPPTDEELAEPDPIADPILIIERTEDVVVAHGRNTMIFGKPGGGKTWLALWIAILVARSGGRVVYYNWDQSTEKGNKKLWRRLMRLKYWRPEYRDRIRIIAAKQFTPEELAERRKLANEWLKAGKSPELALVVIDTISNAGGALNNGRDYKAWAEVAITPHSLEDIGTLSLAHEAKNEPNGPFGSVLALADCDTAIRAVCLKGQTMFNRQQSGEFTLILKKDREGDSATPEEAPVAVIEGDPSEGYLNLRCKPPGSRVEQMLNDSTGPRDLRGDIIKLIRSYDGTYTKSLRKMRDELECNAGALRAELKGLVDEEVLDKIPHGTSSHYKLIDG